MTKITKLLVANRGEIAIRIFKTCKKMGIATVAVYSDADANSLFVQLADEAVRIGGKQANESYLIADKIIAAAKQTNANAIHPGYGFLSENAAFAQQVIDNSMIWVGPNPNAIAKMGSKIEAKKIMEANGVPTIPGYQGDDQSITTLKAKAIAIGFPILLKASAGGGGKGMRIVRVEKDLEKAIEAAKNESKNSFGDDTLLIEKYFDSSRHIEFQIFGDQQGNAVHLYERECSIQRRYQKVVEESPSLFLKQETRQKMGDAAIAACKAIAYDNAGTVEFIVAPDQQFYFLEVNTRLQVEHPVTEIVAGLDLVEWQIVVAEGHALPKQQQEIEQKNHAIEVRLYAEDPANNYLPVSGTILAWNPAKLKGLRYDTGITSGSEISTFYDPMIAKIIAKGKDRTTAIQRLHLALQKTVISGFTTNKNFLIALLEHQDFKAGNFDTHFLDQVFQYKGETLHQNTLDNLTCALIHFRFITRQQERTLAQGVPAAWRNNFYQAQQEKYSYNGFEFPIEYTVDNDTLHIQFAEKEFQSHFISIEENKIVLEINNIRRTYIINQIDNLYDVHCSNLGQIVLHIVNRFPNPVEAQVKGAYTAPMPGEITKVLVQNGDKITAGDALIVMVSMKMENTIEAHSDGIIEEIFVTDKQFVENGTLLLKVEDK